MWSKLKTQIESLFDPSLKLEVYCAVYRKKTQHSMLELPRYFFTLDKEIIWDYPKYFVDQKTAGDAIDHYPYNGVRHISDLLRTYLNSPRRLLLDLSDDQDEYNLFSLLKAADRRLSPSKLCLPDLPFVKKILERRKS